MADSPVCAAGNYIRELVSIDVACSSRQTVLARLKSACIVPVPLMHNSVNVTESTDSKCQHGLLFCITASVQH